jgi:hypothetical protein
VSSTFIAARQLWAQKLDILSFYSFLGDFGEIFSGEAKTAVAQLIKL